MRREDARRLLGVALDATADEVERAFRHRVRTAHPDGGGDAATFRRLVEARTALTTAPAASGRSTTRLVVRHALVRRLVRALRARLPGASAPRVH